jgi:hypothetical protein
MRRETCSAASLIGISGSAASATRPPFTWALLPNNGPTAASSAPTDGSLGEAHR